MSSAFSIDAILAQSPPTPPSPPPPPPIPQVPCLPFYPPMAAPFLSMLNRAPAFAAFSRFNALRNAHVDPAAIMLRLQRPVLSMPSMTAQHAELQQVAAGLMRRGSSTAEKPPVAKKYKCDVCGKAFSRSNTLVTHKRIHTGEKPFKCDHCGRAFRQPGNLTRHRLTHTTVKPYVCSQCNKAFNRASNLHTHMRTHTNLRPFSCVYCRKGFHQKIDLRMHLYTHTGDQPFKCETCGKTFSLAATLFAHRRTHHAATGIRMACLHCKDEFVDEEHLHAHVAGKHHVDGEAK